MRTFSIGAFLILAGLISAVAAPQTKPTVEVYKSATCGCCASWIEHLRENGFTVKSIDRTDMAEIKHKHGIPSELSSCHTALVGGYMVEGHVPAADVQRLLNERPAIAGLAVPGMPVGSPGMEGPGGRPYDVVSFDKQGNVEVFATHRP